MTRKESLPISQKNTKLIPAATAWLKYDPRSPHAPAIGEWCLWSIEINGKREYLSGFLYIPYKSDNTVLLQREGFRDHAPIKPNETLYYARIRKLED